MDSLQFRPTTFPSDQTTHVLSVYSLCEENGDERGDGAGHQGLPQGRGCAGGDGGCGRDWGDTVNVSTVFINSICRLKLTQFQTQQERSQ